MAFLRYEGNPGADIKALDAFQRRAADPAPLLERFGRHMRETSIPANFREGGRPTPWKETRRGGQILMDSARLARSIETEVAGPELRVGTNVKYARIHQMGGVVEAKSKLLAVPVNTLKTKPRPAHYGDRLKWAPGRPGAQHRGVLIERAQRGARVKRATVRFVLLERVTIPARPFLLFQASDLARFEADVVRYVLEGT